MKTSRRVIKGGEAVEASPAGNSTVSVVLPQGGWKAAAYVLSLIPGVGFTLGLLFASSSDPKARRFGRICLVLGLLGLILSRAMAASNFDSGDRLIEGFY